MVDSGAYSSVMRLSIYEKLNVDIKPSEVKIIQLDYTNVKVVGELNGVLIRLSSTYRIHQIINIVVVDIPEA